MCKQRLRGQSLTYNLIPFPLTKMVTHLSLVVDDYYYYHEFFCTATNITESHSFCASITNITTTSLLPALLFFTNTVIPHSVLQLL